MTKHTYLVFSLCFAFTALLAQKPKAPATPVITENRTISKTDLQRISSIEDTLALLSKTFTFDSSLAKRQEACYAFIPAFVRALKPDNSFYYLFDSLETVSKIYAPDSSFRIFTWQLVLPKGRFRYFGVIQMRSVKMKIYPLHDRSDTMTYHTQKVLSNENWYGCLYYNIITKYVDKRPVYTLFGFEGADYITRRKVVDILSFDEKGHPKFGAPIFFRKQEEDSFRYKRTDTFTRFFIEYKYNAATVFNYNPEMDMIVFDHVAPPTEKAKGATFSYVPDGTYEGFAWNNNRWNWVEKVFTFAINENDNPPIPAPLFGEPNRQPMLPKEDVKPK